MSGLFGCVIPLNTSIGHNHEENQVSRTSSSWRRGDPVRPGVSCEPDSPYTRDHSRCASSSVSATTNLPCSSYQAGIRWPHQSCLDIHQSLMFSSQYL